MRTRALPLALVLIAAAGGMFVSPLGVMMLAPALLLLALLYAGRTPGEALLLGWRRTIPRRRRRAVALVPRGHRALVVRACGDMAASALAMRPPPASFPRVS